MRILLALGIGSFVLSGWVSLSAALPTCNGTTADSPTRCTDNFQLCGVDVDPNDDEEDECADFDICEIEWWECWLYEPDIRKNRTNNDSKPRNCISGNGDDYCADLTPVKCYVMQSCYAKWVFDHYECTWGSECQSASYADVVENQECETSGSGSGS